MPICFVVRDGTVADPRTVLYSPLDEKPKQVKDVREMARVRDIRSRPSVALLFDRWSEDWSRLAWIRATGTATLMEPHEDAATHRAVVAALRAKYPQYREQRIEHSPLIRVPIDDTVAWSAHPEFDAP